MNLSTHFRDYPPSPLGNLKTLGLAAYLDAPNNEKRAKYFLEAGASNAILLNNFGELYEHILQAVTDVTGQRTFLTSQYAIPGFHVFDPFTYSKARLKKAHIDIQYSQVEPSYRFTAGNTQDHLTITLVIAEPPGGAFIEFYDFDLTDSLVWNTGVRGIVNKYARSKIPALLCRMRRRKIYRYPIGKLILTIGLPMHRIWLLKNESDPGLRVSLQGHGVLQKDAWELFW